MAVQRDGRNRFGLRISRGSVDSIGGKSRRLHREKKWCGFNTKVLDEHLPIAMDVLSDSGAEPGPSREEDIEKEKGVISRGNQDGPRIAPRLPRA